MIKDVGALPVSSLEVAVGGAVFCELYFAVLIVELGVDFFLAFGADAFGLAHINHLAMASTMRASGNNIIDMVTMRSYLRMFCMVDPEMRRFMAE